MLATGQWRARLSSFDWVIVVILERNIKSSLCQNWCQSVMNLRRHWWFLLRGHKVSMEKSQEADGWMSWQNLLEESAKEEEEHAKRKYQYERRVSYKKAVDQARKIHPEFPPTKCEHLQEKGRDNETVSEAMELEDFSNSNTHGLTKIDNGDLKKSKLNSTQISTNKVSLWAKGRQSFKKIISVSSAASPLKKETKRNMVKFKKEVRSHIGEDKEETEQERAERGMLYMLFRPGNKKF